MLVQLNDTMWAATEEGDTRIWAEAKYPDGVAAFDLCVAVDGLPELRFTVLGIPNIIKLDDELYTDYMINGMRLGPKQSLDSWGAFVTFHTEISRKDPESSAPISFIVGPVSLTTRITNTQMAQIKEQIKDVHIRMRAFLPPRKNMVPV